MKKLFTLIAAIMCAVCVNAQTRTTLWEGSMEFGSTWPSIAIPTSEFAMAKAGDKIVVTVVKADNSINSEWQWGPQIFINVDWSNLTDQVTGNFSDGATNFEHVCEITAAGLEHIKSAKEVEVQGMNVVVSKVELESSLPIVSTAIWEGECSFGNWENGFVIPAEKFVNVNAGDAVEFIYTTDDNNPDTWWQFKTIINEIETLLEGNASDLNEWGCATVAKGSSSYKITLTENDVTALKEKGMYVNGYYNIVTKVNLIQTVPTAIQSVKSVNENNVRYNLLGVKNGNGVYIMNGKKYLK